MGRTATWTSSLSFGTIHRRSGYAPVQCAKQCGEPGSPRISCHGEKPISRNGRRGSGRRCRPPSCAREGPLRDSLVSSDNARAREAHDWLGKAADDLGSCRALMVSGYLGQRALLLPAGCRKEPEGIPDLSRQDAPAHARHRTTWRNMLPDRRHAGFAPRRSRCPF